MPLNRILTALAGQPEPITKWPRKLRAILFWSSPEFRGDDARLFPLGRVCASAADGDPEDAWPEMSGRRITPRLDWDGIQKHGGETGKTALRRAWGE